MEAIKESDLKVGNVIQFPSAESVKKKKHDEALRKLLDYAATLPGIKSEGDYRIYKSIADNYFDKSEKVKK
jgi:hypothetical protein